MKKLILLFSIVYLFSACNSTQTSKKESVSSEATTTSTPETAQASNITSSEQDGYTMMKQFCFSCHFEKPDPSKRDQIIAPPMANVQQHYKSTYPDKEEFIQAVVNWVNKPDENKILMPGAVRRFNLMPPLPIGDDKLKAIASALYERNFGAKMDGHKKEHNMMGGKLQLNKGAKWKLADTDMNKIRQIQKKLQKSDLKDIKAYHQLGKDVFNSARGILLNKNYKAETLQQIQTFFHNIEDEMHSLMAVKTVEDGKKYQNILLKKFMEFNHYFE